VVTTWWTGLSPEVILALKVYIITLVLEEGARHIIRSLSEDERYEKIEWEWGYWIFDRKLQQIVAGEKWTDSVHQVWVHVPGEGDLGGHWEDDLDGDGVAASVDDDDNDPTVGDEG
jgi:hypothetical protein